MSRHYMVTDGTNVDFLAIFSLFCFLYPSVIVLRYLSIVFAFFFEMCLLHQRVDALAFGGGAAIIVGCVVSVRSQSIFTGKKG